MVELFVMLNKPEVVIGLLLISELSFALDSVMSPPEMMREDSIEMPSIVSLALNEFWKR